MNENNGADFDQDRGEPYTIDPMKSSKESPEGGIKGVPGTDRAAKHDKKDTPPGQSSGWPSGAVGSDQSDSAGYQPAIYTSNTARVKGTRGWLSMLFTRGREGWRLAGSRAGSHITRQPYIVKWLILGSLIGVSAGLGAVVFYTTLVFATHFFLGVLVGYKVPTPAGEGNVAGSAHYLRVWALPLVVGLGGLISGLLVFTWAPEAEGHGTDAAIDAVHHRPRGIRIRAVIIKVIASAATIGSGGSGGREGPTAQISAGFGSFLARTLDLSPEDGRLAVSVGIGSGIGAIFSAPLGGAVLSADIVYSDDFNYAALLPGLVASVVAYVIFGAFENFKPLFALPTPYVFDKPIQLVWFLILGIVAGLVGTLYAKVFYGTVNLAHRLHISPKLKPAIGGLLVGMMALGLPELLGTGYGWIQKGLDSQLLSLPLAIVIVLPLARIIATALSIGSGGSGGVFGPGMVIGAFTGMAVWRLLEPIAPGMTHSAAPFVVVGMMACFGSISRAPLAVIIMVAQMTGSIDIIAPALVAVGIAALIVKYFDETIYKAQLRTSADSISGKFRSGLPMLSAVGVVGILRTPRLVLRDTDTVHQAHDLLIESNLPGAPVTDPTGLYVGTVSTEELQRMEDMSQVLQASATDIANQAGDMGYPEQRQTLNYSGKGTEQADGDVEAGNLVSPLAATAGAGAMTLKRIVDATSPTVQVDATLDMAFDAIQQSELQWVPVLDRDRRVVGTVSVGDIVDGYRKLLQVDTERLERLPRNLMVMEERLAANSSLVGQSIKSLDIPGVAIISIEREGTMFFATGASVLKVGDIIRALVRADVAAGTRSIIRGEQ